MNETVRAWTAPTGQIEVPDEILTDFMTAIEEPIAERLLEAVWPTSDKKGVKVTPELISFYYSHRDDLIEDALAEVVSRFRDKYGLTYDHIYIDMLDTWFRSKYIQPREAWKDNMTCPECLFRMAKTEYGEICFNPWCEE